MKKYCQVKLPCDNLGPFSCKNRNSNNPNIFINDINKYLRFTNIVLKFVIKINILYFLIYLSLVPPHLF